MYDLVFLTHIPAFYKINLYNEIAKKQNILVVFISNDTDETRAEDFSAAHKAEFEYVVLNEGSFQRRNNLISCLKMIKLLQSIQYKRIVVSGWDLSEFWVAIYTNKKAKLRLVLESSVHESKVIGASSVIKQVFLSRISVVYASGLAHSQLLSALNYKGMVRITEGVGIINKPSFQKTIKEYSRSFLYVGRLSEEKNLTLLISVFNELPNHRLTIIGTGPLESELKNIANSNIHFEGRVENTKLTEFYLHHDFFILPSLREPWGLVVEEALFFGCPVILSERCGACDLIMDGENGFIFNPLNRDELKSVIESIDNQTYVEMTNNESFDISQKDLRQVRSYG